MINFIFGRCGYGKSKYLKSVILNKINMGEQNIIMVVPEQSSFSSEREIIDILGNEKCNNVNVLSFSRLYDFVAQKLSLPPCKPSTELTQSILMSAVLEGSKEKLEFYKPNSRNNISKLMISTLHELKSRQIEEADLLKIYNNSKSDNIKQKVKEIITIFEKYNEICENKFTDMADNMNMLKKIIENSSIFENYTVIFDEFVSFTNQQLSIIELIIKQSKDVYIALCTDDGNRSKCTTNLFYPAKRTVKLLKSIAKNNNIDVSERTINPEKTRFLNNEIKILEQNIFQPKKQIFNAVPENISLYCAINVHEECENIARSICKLVIDEGYKFRDIAILTRNPDLYAAPIKNAFKKYDIPLFFDHSETILNKSLPNLILSAFECITSDFQTSAVIRYIKSGLLDISPEESSLLENYALLWEIKGAEWFEDFSDHPRGFESVWTEEDKGTIERINEIKQKIILPLINLKHNTMRGSVRKISESVYNFLIESKANESIKNLYKKLKSSGNLQEATSEAKMWEKIIEVLSLTAQIMGDQKIAIRNYILMLFSALECAGCPNIPQSKDCVIAGDAANMKLSSAKIIFIVGASSGDFPMVSKESKIFSQNEIKQIEDLGIEIEENINLKLIKEQFLAYTSLCSASKKLYISWTCVSSDGESAMPSEIVEEIKSIFPNIKTLTKNNFGIKDLMWSESSAFESYCYGYENKSATSNTLKHYFESSPKYSLHCQSLKNSKNQNALTFCEKETAEKLFGENIKLSASQIEKYHKCRFGYFCEYGLNLKCPKPAKFGVLQYGNLMHNLFERLFKKYPENKIIYVPIIEIEKDISEIIDTYVQNKLGKKAKQDPRANYIIEKSKKTATLLLKRIIDELKQSKFVISDCELEISDTSNIKPLRIEISNEKSIEICGKIDRVDTFKEEDKTYLRVIDYKTGKQTFDLPGVLYGLNIQMLIYLLILNKNGAKKYGSTIPAGVLYFKAIKPNAEPASETDFEKSKKDFFNQLKMNGMVLNNPKIIEAMDQSGSGEFIPVSIKNGKISGLNCSASLDEISIIFDYIESVIKQMAENLMSGKIKINPIENGNLPTCNYCDYLDICHYNQENFIKIPSVSKIGRDEIFKQMQEKRSEILSETNMDN